MKNIILTLVTLSCFLSSCKKDADNNSNNASRTLVYEINGNFTGNFIASYTTAAGGTTNEQITTLPWRKEITYNNNVTAAIIALSGNGGVSGQTISLTIKRDQKPAINPVNIIANASGAFSEAAPVIVF
ncbi:hypothetical protein [Pedobacter glucosidilyticus]|uniref:hypothetical protein n=1 Tax=Pedobacter glucosidilyticus TaxID=1122941 RepID=UPI0026ED1AD4|nr:hypothetical protein [Pedobacter glucosidilyticus]